MNLPSSTYTPMQRFHHDIKNQRLTNAQNNIIEEEDEIGENSLSLKNGKEIRAAALEENNHSDDDGEGSYRPKYDWEHIKKKHFINQPLINLHIWY